MSLMCQKDSFLKEFESSIVSYQQSKLKLNEQEVDGYDVVLEDTIFFPEGGGQPCDLGTLGNRKVLDVRREGRQAVLFVENGSPEAGDSQLEVGKKPLQKIDWQRRFDHMQQHSGQHLITAVALKFFNLETTSWTLGPRISNIELNSANISDEVLTKLEEEVNEKIRENVPVVVSYRAADDLGDIRKNFDIPIDSSESVRIVSIENLDKNPCCGTHVPSMATLQVVKLLGVQKGKKGKCLLNFVVGNRALKYFDDSVKREKQLTIALKCLNEEIVERVEKLQKNGKLLKSHRFKMMADVGKLEGDIYVNLAEKPKLYCLDRAQPEPNFFTSFINVAGKSIGDNLVLLTVFDETSSDYAFQFVIAGKEDLAKQSGQLALDQAKAKGSYFPALGQFQGRLPKLANLKALKKAITEFLDKIN